MMPMPLGAAHALGDRLRAERREQRRGDRAGLQHAEDREVQLRDAVGEEEDAVGLRTPMPSSTFAKRFVC